MSPMFVSFGWRMFERKSSRRIPIRETAKLILRRVVFFILIFMLFLTW